MSDARKRVKVRLRRLLPTRHKLRRVFRDCCEECGRRGRWNESWHTFGNRDGKHWHGICIALAQRRTQVDEAMAVLDLICDVWNVDSRAVQQVAELRGGQAWDEANQKNRAWRVMYALERRREAASSGCKVGEVKG